MHIYSDSRIPDFLREITIDQSVSFLNKWNERRDPREKVYVSYDSTNKNVRAGDISFAEFGHPKDDKGVPVINYAIAYDRSNRESLFYEDYPGSINDVSQFRSMVDKARAFGYQKIGLTLTSSPAFFSISLVHENRFYTFFSKEPSTTACFWDYFSNLDDRIYMPFPEGKRKIQNIIDQFR